MLTRCKNPNVSCFDRYGSIGICVCEGLQTFADFLSVLGERPEGTTLGRFLDLNNYSCGACEQCKKNGWLRNVAWQTFKEQGAERKGNTAAMMRFRAIRAEKAA